MTDTVTAPAAAPEPDATVAIFPWWLLLIQGIAAVIVGIFLVRDPAATAVTLVYFVGWWWLVSGVFDFISLFWNRQLWGWKIFSGILGIIAGAYIISSPILGTAVVVGVAALLLGINGIILGVIDVVKAFQGAGWGKGIIGVLSFLFGVLILMNYWKVAVVLPWVWGMFAIVFGIAAIIMSFRVRRVAA